MNEASEHMNGITFQPSEKIQEIVSNKPGFLIRYGNVFFLLVLILVCTTCWYVKYPDIIKTTAKLTCINAPKPIISLINGKLIKLNITENQYVSKGQILGYLESTANHAEVLTLACKLDTIHVLLSEENHGQIKKYFQNPSLELGELQEFYQTFSQAFLSFNNYLEDGLYLKKEKMLLKDKENLKKLYKNLDEQKELHEQDLGLIQRTFDANESLKNNKVISDFDYRSEQSKLISKKLTLPQIRAAMISNESQQIDKEKEIIELKNAIDQQKLIFQQSFSTFKNQVNEWKKKYLLISPISGKIAFNSFLEENQQLKENQIVCFINPENSQYFAEIVIPQSNFGKVAVSQKVLLKFQSYPFQEYGVVQGKIEFISHISGENGYLAKVIFTNGLQTTYHKKIQYHDGLLANAEIVTKDLRLLERFYYGIRQQVN